jgi:hypothetical protein
MILLSVITSLFLGWIGFAIEFYSGFCGCGPVLSITFLGAMILRELRKLQRRWDDTRGDEKGRAREE